jgi:hypothetical protein
MRCASLLTGTGSPAVERPDDGTRRDAAVRGPVGAATLRFCTPGVDVRWCAAGAQNRTRATGPTLVPMSMWRRTAGRNVPDDRAWSAHTSVHPRSAPADLVPYTALHAETGPVWAPYRLSIWPVEGGLIRIGPLTHAATWLALEAFLGRPP